MVSPFATGMGPTAYRPGPWGGVPAYLSGAQGGLPAVYRPTPVPVAYVPRVRTVSPGGDQLALSTVQAATPDPGTVVSPAPIPAPIPEAVPAAETPPPTPTASEPIAAESRAIPAERAPAESMTRGQEIGAQIGQFLDNNPKILAEVEKMDPDRLMADPASFANELKARFQRSRSFRWLQRLGVDKRIAQLLPADTEPQAMKFLEWLKTPVDSRAASGGESAFNLSDYLAEDPAAGKKSRFSLSRRKSEGFSDPLDALAAAAV